MYGAGEFDSAGGMDPSGVATDAQAEFGTQESRTGSSLGAMGEGSG